MESPRTFHQSQTTSSIESDLHKTIQQTNLSFTNDHNSITICACANIIDKNHNDKSSQSPLRDSANSGTTNDTFNNEKEK